MALHEEIEAELQCPSCHGIPYQIFRKQAYEGSPVYVHEIRPVSGSPPVVDFRRIACPRCGMELRRLR